MLLPENSRRTRNIPESPPDKKSETNPSANNIAVVKRVFAFHNVPNQQITSSNAGAPSEDASMENTSGVYGFNPLANMCSPQMQNPTSPTAHKASTAIRSLHSGTREYVARRCVTIPKHGNIAT